MPDLMRLLMPSRASLTGHRCPACGSGAECVVPNFYVCGTPGCANGPPALRSGTSAAEGNWSQLAGDEGCWAFRRSYRVHAWPATAHIDVEERWEVVPPSSPKLASAAHDMIYGPGAKLSLAGLGQFEVRVLKADGSQIATPFKGITYDQHVPEHLYSRVQVDLLAAGGGRVTAWSRT